MSRTKERFKVLCVDDEPDLVRILSDAVSEIGFDPIAATNGQEALRLLEESGSRIALIISDVVMPTMNGFDFRKTMQAEHRPIPFVIATGQVTLQEALQALESKIAGFIEKPYTIPQIQEVVRRESASRIASLEEDEEMRAGFVAEAGTLIEEMEGLLMDLEGSGSDPSSINRIFACAHTIKGTSGFFKPDTIHRFTHRYEDYLSSFKRSPSSLNSNGVETLLRGLDTIKRLVDELAGRIPRNQTPLEELLRIFEAPLQGSPSAPVAPVVPSRTVASPVEEIRVSVPLLDRFMERSGELTVLRNMVNKSVRVIESENPASPHVAALSELLSEMHKVNAYIQDQVVDMRKVALRQVFKPVARTLRDLGISLKKKVVLETTGEDLRIDHTLAEALNKCLIHLIRNAADHGIESPETRVSAGKDPTGHLWLSAREEDEEVVIRIKDDGKGIDPGKIKSKAVEKGIITQARAQEISEAEARLLIFEPGFSTAEQVTDVSGRGVGTDMVKGTIQALGGKIELNSTVGKGTEFVLRLPIPKSVLIIASLIVRAHGFVFAVPQDCIVRVINVNEEVRSKATERIGGALFLKDASGLIPILDLRSLLGLEPSDEEPAVLLHVRSDKGDYCVGVREVSEIEDTVVRKPGPWFQKVPLYSGATFLADGSIGLILDANGIAARYGLQPRPQENGLAQSIRGDRGSSGSSMLLIDLGSRTKYAALQSDIFRLEVFPNQKVQNSGNQKVVLYREKTMPLIDLRENPSKSDDPAAPFTVLVAESASGFKGFVVGAIHDFVRGEATDTQGLYFVKDSTIRLLRLVDPSSNK